MLNKIEIYFSKYWLRSVLRITIVQFLLSSFYVFWENSANASSWSYESRLMFSVLSLMQILINCVMVYHEANPTNLNDDTFANLLVTEEGIINNSQS